MVDGEQCGSENGGHTKGRSLALALASITGGIAVALSVISYPFVVPAFRKICLPYVPASPQQIRNIMLCLPGRVGSLIDLGSGDGRVVLSAAAAGVTATGVELNPWLVFYSRATAWRRGLRHAASFRRADLFTVDLGRYDNVVIFGVEQMMPSVEQMLAERMTASARAIVCRFPLPTWSPVSSVGEGIDTVWVYRPPRRSTDSSGHIVT